MTVRNLFFAFLLVLFAVTVTKTERSGGAATTGSGSGGGAALTSTGGVACSVSAEAVRINSAGNRILAPGSFRCDRPGADRVDVAVFLQKIAANGQWTNVSRQTLTATGTGTTRDRPVAQRTRTASAACATGVYRTLVEASATDAGKRRVYRDTSGTRTNPCR